MTIPTKSKLRTAAIATSLLLLSSGAVVQAAGNGSTPNGKPFVEIQGQIVEVQGTLMSLQEQIDAIVGNATSLEERLTLSENAILELQAENAALLAQINELTALALANGVDIAAMQVEIETLRGQITDLQALAGDHSADILALEGRIADLQSQIAANAAGLFTLQADVAANFDLIDGLQDQIDQINVTLAEKQDILDLACPVGWSLRVIDPDGIACEFDNSGIAGIARSIASVTGTVPGSYTYCTERILGVCVWWQTDYYEETVTAHCQSGYSIVGGGWFASSRDLQVTMDRVGSAGSIGDEAWSVTARNPTSNDEELVVRAVCIAPYTVAP